MIEGIKMKKLIIVLLSVVMLSSPSFAAKRYKTDILIIGAGTGGLVAALKAKQAGVNLIVLEKQAHVGGVGNFMEGTLAIGSRMQKAAGYTLTTDEAFQKIMTYNHWKGNAKMIRAFIDKSAETMNWLQDIGVPFEGIKTAFTSGGNMTWHVYKNGSGTYMIKTVYGKLKALNTDIRTETKGTSLIVKKGKVVGVKAEDADGRKYNFYAKAVILATGGYAGNKAMMKEYNKFRDEAYQILGPMKGRNGDGINMGAAIGAELEGMHALEVAGAWVDIDGIVGDQFVRNSPKAELRSLMAQPFLWVSPKGERFYNETLSYDWPLMHNALERIGGIMYSILNDDLINFIKKNGTLVASSDVVAIGNKLTHVDAAIKEGIKKGYVFKSSTLEGLARQTGMDPAKLKKAVANNNAQVKAGNDYEFGKDKAHLRAINKGPYYAIRGKDAYFETLGGLRVNEHAQVIEKATGNPIPGLYATGHDAGGMYGDTYDLLMEGSSSSFAINSAAIAVDHILETILKK